MMYDMKKDSQKWAEWELISSTENWLGDEVKISMNSMIYWKICKNWLDIIVTGAGMNRKCIFLLLNYKIVK